MLNELACKTSPFWAATPDAQDIIDVSTEIDDVSSKGLAVPDKLLLLIPHDNVGV